MKLRHATVGERSPERQETMSATTSAAVPAGTTLHWYRLVVVLLAVALAAMTALTVYLAVARPTTAADPPASPAPLPTSQAHDCYKPAVPC
jgi:cytochrome c-type biogenesis protein CcmH/NrfG